jgi:integrase
LRGSLPALLRTVPRWRRITAIFTGLRGSELRGLRWVDVDLKAGKLYVKQRADRYNAISKPKSKSSVREIPIGPFVVNTLREWRVACPHDLVFPTSAGHIEYHTNLVQRVLIPVQRAAGVVTADGKAKCPGLHALRHFYASWCINRKEDGGLGLTPKMVQARLGHSSIMMTMDVYGHLFPSDDKGSELAEAERRLLR